MEYTITLRIPGKNTMEVKHNGRYRIIMCPPHIDGFDSLSDEELDAVIQAQLGLSQTTTSTPWLGGLIS